MIDTIIRWLDRVIEQLDANARELRRLRQALIDNPRMNSEESKAAWELISASMPKE